MYVSYSKFYNRIYEVIMTNLPDPCFSPKTGKKHWIYMRISNL